MRSAALVVLATLVFLGPAAAGAAPTDRVAHGDVVVAPGEQVADAVSFGGDLLVSGWVTGDAVAFGGDVRVLPGARVEGDISALGGSITVDPGAVALGDRVALGGPGGGLLRDRHQGSTAAPAAGPLHGLDSLARSLHRVGAHIGHLVGLFLLLFLVGAVMLGLAPQRTRALAAAVATFPAKSLGLGLAVAATTIAAIVVLSVTVVGIPVAALVAAVAGGAAVLGLTGVAILIGELVPAKGLKDRQVAKLAVGAGLLVAALALPFAGPLLGVFATVLGLGSLAVTRLRPGNEVFVAGSGPYRSAPAP